MTEAEKKAVKEIYNYALQYGGADYHPMGSGVVYLTSEYYRAKKFGFPPMPVRVADVTTGEILGTIPTLEELDEVEPELV